jgi:hypothetical protein
MSIYIAYGSLHSDRMSDAGARESSTRGKLAVVGSVCRENLGGEVDVGADTRGISCNIGCCLSESAMQGGKSDGKDEKEAWEAHGYMWILLRAAPRYRSCTCGSTASLTNLGDGGPASYLST